MDAHEALIRWCEELVTLREHAPRTISDHRRHLQGVISTIANESGVDALALPLTALTRPALVRALSEYHAPASDTPRAPASVARRLAAIRSFCRWCVEMELSSTDPSRTLRTPRARRTRPVALTAEAARALLAATQRSRWPERDRLLVLLCLADGLRLNELATLTLAGWEPGPPPRLLLHAGTDRERTVACAALTQQAVEAYLPTRTRLLRRRGSTTPALLCTRNAVGREGGDLGLTSTAVVAIFERLAASAGVPASARTLRATYASLALSASHTPLELAAQLGLSSPQAVTRYAEVDLVRLDDAQSAHPLAALLEG